MMTIPKPEFVECDETNIKVTVRCVCGVGKVLKLQYKEPYEAWPVCKELNVSSSTSEHPVITTVQLLDLKPGSAYFLRIARRDVLTNGTDVGGEVVFDTKPIECSGSRRGICSIS